MIYYIITINTINIIIYYHKNNINELEKLKKNY